MNGSRRASRSRWRLQGVAVCCCVATLVGCTERRRAPVVVPSSEASQVATQSAGALSADTDGTDVAPNRLPFQKGQPNGPILPGFTVGKIPIPDVVLNAGVPETPEELEACEAARVYVRVDQAYPAVRLGRTIPVQERGEEMALHMYPGLEKKHGLLTGYGLQQREPCWVPAYEKLSDEAYYDHVTDRTWHLETSRFLDWDGALQYIAELNAASGDSGWRIPTTAELLTLAAAYEQWVFTRVQFGAVTRIRAGFWSSDEPVGVGAKPGFHTEIFPKLVKVDYTNEPNAHVLAVRRGRWLPPPRPRPPIGRVVPGHRHPESLYPLPGRVLPAGIVRTPEAVHQCAAAGAMYSEHGVFPPIRVTERISLRREPRRTTIDELSNELVAFDFGAYVHLPPSCFLLAVEKRGRGHFVEWVTGLEWKFLSPDDRRLTYDEINQALADLNGQATDKAEAWRLPTFIELAMFGTAQVVLWDFGSGEMRRVPVWLADLDGTKRRGQARLCTKTGVGAIEGAQGMYQGRCAALLVRTLPQQPNQP